MWVNVTRKQHFINRSSVRNKSNTLRPNKKGFEGSLLNNARKAVDGFRSINRLCCYVNAKQRAVQHITRGYSLLFLCAMNQIHLDSIKKVKYNLKLSSVGVVGTFHRFQAFQE